MKITFERTFDTHDCDTCGTAWAEGANIYLDGEIFLEFIPVAHCFDGTHFDDNFIYAQILAKLGYEVDLKE